MVSYVYGKSLYCADDADQTLPFQHQKKYHERQVVLMVELLTKGCCEC